MLTFTIKTKERKSPTRNIFNSHLKALSIKWINANLKIENSLARLLSITMGNQVNIYKEGFKVNQKRKANAMIT